LRKEKGKGSGAEKENYSPFSSSEKREKKRDKLRIDQEGEEDSPHSEGRFSKF